MKLVGATNWFIRWPFVIEGVTVGLVGAGLALALVLVALPSCSTRSGRVWSS